MEITRCKEKTAKRGLKERSVRVMSELANVLVGGCAAGAMGTLSVEC